MWGFPESVSICYMGELSVFVAFVAGLRQVCGDLCLPCIDLSGAMSTERLLFDVATEPCFGYLRCIS